VNSSNQVSPGSFVQSAAASSWLLFPVRARTLPLLRSQACRDLLPVAPEQNPRRRPPRPMGLGGENSEWAPGQGDLTLTDIIKSWREWEDLH
jgi:hypothetical protein